ncbi:interleukin 19 like [Nerophis ophidion]|uniref:interleukin 19 like n=1 Tax=Nerophis ophidion TaxID=159077 RepID=UPI002AE040B8|nr:interleukin 19 like [Nerophis ophidion]
MAAMKRIPGFSTLLLLSFLSELSFGRTLKFNNCEVSVHTHELRRHYSEMRSIAISEDTEIGVMILNRSTMTSLQVDQTCCYLRLILRFYTERVFRNYASSQPRYSSALANAFVTVRRNINKCHCLCEEDTQRAMDSLNAEFDKLSINKAAKKAVAEMDALLDWLEELEESSAAAATSDLTLTA